ncbi:hypothetical protein NGRA_0758 [Nosema granulosis]|uniref:THUMP domain-containing protein n=1 Tax=Nosema granulosis TaxID=83296 RepID=A0A9P6KZR5_9MICR|nr:hypothetical protein NGRA_0758 [Nosema granulosis]
MKSGFYVSCKKGREEKAFKEFLGVLTNLVDSSKTYDNYENINIREEILKEVKSLEKNPFKIYFQYRSMFFVSNDSELSPSCIFRALRERAIYFSYIQRIIPIDEFFKFDSDKIKSFIQNKFMHLHKSYKIIYEERFVPEDTRLKVFDSITNVVNLKVDLTSPYYLVVVQALKNNVGISIITDEPSNFNFSKENSTK